jgi:SH3-like domain-containing protein
LWSFILLCLFSFSSVFAQGLPAAKPGQFPFTARVKGDHVKIRAGQSNNYEVLSEVNTSDELVVTGKNYSWYKVSLPEGSKLYLKMGYMKLLSTEVGEITADRVNIRARPNTEAAIIGQLVRGDQFFIRENTGEWLWIRPLAKAFGWVHEDLLEFKSKGASAKLFQDPADAAARVKAEKAASERKRLAKFAGLKSRTDGLYEAEGVLAKFDGGKGISYKLMGGAKGDVCVAYIDGPASMLMHFAGGKVVVRGAAKDDASLDAAVLTVSKIHLSL